MRIKLILISLVLLIVAILLLIVGVHSALSANEPTLGCEPYNSESFPPDPYFTFPPPNKVFCYVVAYDSAGRRFDFDKDGCQAGRCVTGLHKRGVLKAESGIGWQNVTTFVTSKITLPIVLKNYP